MYMGDSADSTYYPDKAILKIESDLFNFNPTAKVLANNILNLSKDDSYTIAVNGDWGSGKSSFLNLVRHHLEGSVGNKSIVLDFDPWMFSGRDDIVIQLFLHIRAELQKFNTEKKNTLDPNIFETFDSVLGCIQSISTLSGIPGLPLFVSGIRTGSQIAAKRNQKKIDEINNINTQRKDLCEKLKNLSSKLVIIIDNIDRLTGTEIRQIFQAIKSVSDFPNIVYILAYDQRIVEEALDFEFHQHYSTTPESGRDYLKKIVQFSLPVPDTTPYLKRYAEDLLLSLNEKTHPKNWNENTDVVGRWNELYQYGLAPVLKTPRDIIRMYNILVLVSASYESGLDYLDLLCIQVIREYEPELYETIRKNPKYFYGKAYNFSEYDYLLLGVRVENTEYPSDVEHALYLSRIFKKYYDKLHVLYLLVSLFPDIRKVSSGLDISSNFMVEMPPYISSNPVDSVNSHSIIGDRIQTNDYSYMRFFGCHMPVYDTEEPWEEIIAFFWKPEEFQEKLLGYESKRPPQGLTFLNGLLSAINKYNHVHDEDSVTDIFYAILSLKSSIYCSKSNTIHYNYRLLTESKNILLALFKNLPPKEAISSFSKGMNAANNIVLISFIIGQMWKYTNSRTTKPLSDIFGEKYTYNNIGSALKEFKEPWESAFDRLIGDDPFNLLLPDFGSVYSASLISEKTKMQLESLITKIWLDDDLLVSFIERAVTEKYLTYYNRGLLLIYDTTPDNFSIERASEKIENLIKSGRYSMDTQASLRKYKELLFERPMKMSGF